MTTPTQGEHAQTEALNAAQILEYWAKDLKGLLGSELLFAAAELRRLHAKVAALTALPAAPQGVAYAEPEFKMGRGYIERSIGGVAYRDGWVDALEALRASNGQAPAGAAPIGFTKEWREKAAADESEHGTDFSAGIPTAQPAPAATPQADSQPAPVQDMELPESVVDAVAAALGDAYDCTRTWSAWSYGTMGSDDFLLVAEDGERVAEIARAAINAYRAARAPADSVTAPVATPAAASIAWNALRDATDQLGEDGSKIMGHVRVFAQRQYEAGLAEGRAAPANPAASGLPFGIIDPDYARVFTQARIIAWQYGYACVMHGSFTRDLDLLLVPWTEQASDNHDQLLKLIAGSCGLRFRDGKEEVYESTVDFTDKPHGRKSCSLFFKEFGDRRWIDISIVPRPLYTTPPAPADSVLEDAARLERERICAAIKAEDDYCIDHGDYMLDSDDCIKIVRGEWVRPDFSVDAARKQGANHDNT